MGLFLNNFKYLLASVNMDRSIFDQDVISTNAGDFFEEWKEITYQINIRKGLLRLALVDSDQWD